MEVSSRYDVVVVGGGTAGLSAALVLGRSLRRTLVLDTGEPRNAPSSGVHGFFSRDGIRPEELLKIGREQLKPYPSVELRQARGFHGSFQPQQQRGDRPKYDCEKQETNNRPFIELCALRSLHLLSVFKADSLRHGSHPASSITALPP